jgi:outer membrane lipoprotein SlyB
MRFSTLVIVSLLALILASCASYRGTPGDSGVIVDTKGVDMSTYQQDVAECEALADEVPVVERAATGGAVGAVVGGAIGAIFGDPGQGAGTGAVSGTVEGANSGLSEADQVLKRCLQGRGYRVLN